MKTETQRLSMAGHIGMRRAVRCTGEDDEDEPSEEGSREDEEGEAGRRKARGPEDAVAERQANDGERKGCGREGRGKKKFERLNVVVPRGSCG
jgi:hypothetical protein